MAHNVNSRATSPADLLRDDLDEVEKLVVGVAPDNVETLLLTLDRIDGEFERLAGSGMDLRPEQSRWDSMIQRVNTRAPAIAGAAAKGPGYARLRKSHAIGLATEFSFWWFLDHEATRQRRRVFLRTAGILGTILGVIVLGYWAMQTFFPPDPQDVLYADVMYQMDQFSQEQAWSDALAVIEANLPQLTDEPDLYLWRGVLAEQLDRPELAKESLEQAQTLLAGRDVLYWNSLGNRRLQVGNLDGADAALRRALKLDPSSAQAYFLLGGLAEAKQDYPQAMEYYSLTYDMAEKDDPQLAVIARVRVGQIMQMPSILPTETPAGPPASP